MVSPIQWTLTWANSRDGEEQRSLMCYSLWGCKQSDTTVGSILGSSRSLGEENGNPLQYSCLENPMVRGTCRPMVHRVTKSQTPLKRLSMHARMLLTLGFSASDRLSKGTSDERKVRLGHMISKRTMETVPGERRKVAV